MRALKLSSFLFVFVLILANAESAQAQMNTYELGPFHVEGYGINPAEAEAEAYGELFDFMVWIQTTLPPGHVVLDFEVITEGHTSPTTYVIDFYVIVWDQLPPGPPNEI